MTSRILLLRLAFGCLLVSVLAYGLPLTLGVSYGRFGGAVDGGLYTAVEVAATALVWARAARWRADRAAWVALATFATLWCVGDLGWTLHFDHMATARFPNWTDAVYLASYLCAYAGMVLLLRERIGDARPSRWLDGLVGGLALGALCSALFLGHVVSSAGGSAPAVAVTLAYPVLDLLLLCVVGVAFGTADWRPGPRWTALGAAMAVAAVGDAAYAWQEVVGSYSEASWVNLTWPLGMLLLAWAAWRPDRRRIDAAQADGMFAIPAVCGASSLAILVWSQFAEVPLLATLAAAGTLAVAGLRAWLTHRENVGLIRRTRREALEDGLTGLPNRRRLMLDLDRALQAGIERPATLVFFDLDGFKTYNDNFGHGAGDALLVRLARALVRAVEGIGVAYRLGGDEFCVLVADDVGRDSPQVVGAAAALTEVGEGFEIASSFGLVSLPKEAHSPSLGLQLADERMYAHKASRRGSPGRQVRDLLLQILREREPELKEHVDDVGALALAVGRELGLDVEALDEIARGAELHDIGKIAVPEDILHKAGPLDAGEWDVMRQHTIVGERILAAAPALRPVARLVRSSHERWDGSGYPDGLAGARIPLGARIISVCDAFDAMRQARPYAGSMVQDAAMAELRRCAGTQFDPQVVEAFQAVLARGAADRLRVA
jgi:two-component system cell cycle response regulator